MLLRCWTECKILFPCHRIECAPRERGARRRRAGAWKLPLTSARRQPPGMIDPRNSGIRTRTFNCLHPSPIGVVSSSSSHSRPLSDESSSLPWDSSAVPAVSAANNDGGSTTSGNREQQQVSHVVRRRNKTKAKNQQQVNCLSALGKPAVLTWFTYSYIPRLRTSNAP